MPTRALAMTAMTSMVLLASACGSDTGKEARPNVQPPRTSQPATPDAGTSLKGKTPAQILAAAQQALSSAQSFHIRGFASDNGKKMKLNIRIGTNAAEGTIQGGLGGVDATIRIRRVGQTYYLRGNREFWQKTAGPQVARKIRKRWVELPPKSKLDQAKTFASPATFAKVLSQPAGSLTKLGKTAKVKGQQAVVLDDGKSRLFVAMTGKPYPLKIKPNRPALPGEKVLFLDYDAPLNVQPPAKALKPGVIGPI